MLTYKLNGHNKPLPMTEADSRVSQFMNCSMALVDLFQRDYELSALERACMDSYLRLIELSYHSWKRRTDHLPPPQASLRSYGRSDHRRGE
jgi:hypothetical protein